METGLSNRTYQFISLLWWLIVVSLFIYFYLYIDNFKHPLFAVMRAIPITAGILLYYYGHQYLINRYLLNNDTTRYTIFLLALLVVQSVGSYNINYFLWMSNPVEAEKFYNQFRFFFGVSLLFDLCTFQGILATIKAMSIHKKLEAVQTEHNKIRDMFLRSQINHHSLLNTMNSIYYLSITNPDATSDAILKASDLLKYILVQTEKETVPVTDELKFICSYIELQKLRLGTTRQIEFEPPAYNVPYTIPPMLLIVLIENAFKYSATRVQIRVNIQGDELELECTNDILKSSGDSSKIGLKNLKDRLHFIYDGQYIYKNSEANGCYQAYLKIKISL